MRIFNQNKTQIITNPDLTKGYLVLDTIPFEDAGLDGEETILVYIPYTEAELHKIHAENRIAELKKLLADTDYQAIKFAEGELSSDEYEPTKQNRRAWRAEINQLESQL